MDTKLNIFKYVESRMTYIAPNCSALLGASTAAKIMGLFIYILDGCLHMRILVFYNSTTHSSPTTFVTYIEQTHTGKIHTHIIKNIHTDNYIQVL